MTDDTCEALIEAAARSNTVTLLTLSGLELESVPESLDAPWTTRITRLFLSRNRISRLPPWFCARFEGLTGLYLHTNELVELPDDLARLSNLTELILARNQLSFLPHSLGQLTNLRQLTLSNNRIASLLESLSRLRSLELFNAGFNRLPVRIAGGEVLDKDVAQYLFYACNGTCDGGPSRVGSHTLTRTAHSLRVVSVQHPRTWKQDAATYGSSSCSDCSARAGGPTSTHSSRARSAP